MRINRGVVDYCYRWDAYCTGACFAALARTYVEHTPAGTQLATTMEDVVLHAGNRLNGTSALVRWDLTTDTDTSDAEIRGGAVFHVAGIKAADGGDKVRIPHTLYHVDGELCERALFASWSNCTVFLVA